MRVEREVDGAALVDMMGAVVCCCVMVVTLGGKSSGSIEKRK